MCGIAGLIHDGPRAGGASRLAGARRALAHRGPDDWGVLAIGPGGARVGREVPSDDEAHQLLWLHLRLSIIDLSEAGWQPMCSPDRRRWIVFNGELYNYLELRRELEGRGVKFRSRSDTEVLLAALETWGPSCLGRLVGMFAFAYADLDAGEVLLARDPFGIKPLYYAEAPGGLGFASEIPGLLELTQGRRRVDAGRLYAYLRHGITDHGAGTLFAGVSQVPAGHSIRISLRPWRVEPPEPYWVPTRLPRRPVSLAQAAEELRAQFCESVRLHLQSDVPVGAALSGGIDSSAIVDVIRHVAGPDAEIHAFSFVPDDAALSEERWIRLAAARAGAQVHTVTPSASEVAGDLARVIHAQGEPFGSPSIYAQYRVFKLAAERGIKVMLNGQGADELFGGYRPYLGARLAGLVRRRRWGQAVGLFAAGRELPGVGAGHLAMLAADVLVPPAGQAGLRRIAGRALVPAWMDGEWFRARAVAPSPVNYTTDRDAFWAVMERALRETSLPHLLRYDDRNSMTVSIESRVPFLTRPMLEGAWSLPEEYVVDDAGTSKRVLREAMRGLVPDEVLDRRDKLGFVTPVATWMAAEGEWVAGLLTRGRDLGIPGVDFGRALALWGSAGDRSARASAQLWRCISYAAWVEELGVEVSA